MTDSPGIHRRIDTMAATKLPQALLAWQTPAFAQTLCDEIHALEEGTLPLEKCTTQGGMVDESKLSVSLLKAHADATTIYVTLATFFSEIVINCGCGADPMPINAYGEMLVSINKQSAEAEFSPLAS